MPTTARFRTEFDRSSLYRGLHKTGRSKAASRVDRARSDCRNRGWICAGTPNGNAFQACNRQGRRRASIVCHPPAGNRLVRDRHPEVERQFEQRADLPAAWAGLSGEDLAAVSGVSDATFCHNGRFIAAATTLAAALEMAMIAVAHARQADH
jgi:hypothetical protein